MKSIDNENALECECASDITEIAEEFEDKTEYFLAPPPHAPLNAFPKEVQAMLFEAAKAFSVPIEIPIACLLALLAGLVGQSKQIRIKESWAEAGNLWVALVASSGMGKTPCMQAFFKELHYLEHEAKNDYDEDLATYKSNLASYREAVGQLSESDASTLKEPDKPKQKQIIVDDATIEALGGVHKDNPKGILWLVDELVGMMLDQDKYSSSKGGTKPRLLSSHSRGHWKTNRLSNPERNTSIPHACLSIFGGIQPNMIIKVFDVADGTDIDSGFLPRFLFVRAVSDKPSIWSEDVFSEKSVALIQKITNELWTWEATNEFMPSAIVEVTPEAKGVYRAWFNSIGEEAYIYSNEQSMLIKLRATALRLCLLLHSLDAVLSGNNRSVVDGDCMRRALQLADWLKIHQQQCWKLFMPQGGQKQPDPVEYALMSVVVELAAKRGDEWQITNKELFPLVRKKLETPQIKDNVIGKIAGKLGITSCRIGKTERGRRVTKELLLGFRNAVSAVIPVRETMEASFSEDD